MGLIQTLSSLARRNAPPPRLDEVLDWIDLLARQDRCIEALHYGCAQAERIDDLALWSRLGRLRLDAVPEAVTRSTPLQDWPPALPDPFPGLIALPEIDAADLDWRVLGGSILHHGSLIVRGLIDPTTAARLRDGIDAALAAYDVHQTDGERRGSADYLPVPIPATEPLAGTRPWSRESGGVWAVESPRLFQTILALYQARGVIDAVGGYLGERPVLSIGKTVFRRAEPTTHGLFHQDGAFMGADIRTVNVWTALSDCGEDAPGLEVVARRLPTIVETGTEGSIFHWAVGRPVAERAAGDAPIAFPKFKAGDALIFDQLMLHATGVKAGMTRRRYAIEGWFFAPSAYAADQIPIVI